jgi:hypothetical protein
LSDHQQSGQQAQHYCLWTWWKRQSCKLLSFWENPKRGGGGGRQDL